MSSKAVRDAFRAKLDAVMPVGFTFKDSINTARQDDAATVYMTADFLPPMSTRLSLGNPGNDWWKETGTVHVVCRVVRGDGVGGATDPEAALATVGAALLGQRFDGVLVTEVDAVDTAGSDDSHFRAVLAVRYWFKYRG
jgi:hypothetical protein